MNGSRGSPVFAAFQLLRGIDQAQRHALGCLGKLRIFHQLCDIKGRDIHRKGAVVGAGDFRGCKAWEEVATRLLEAVYALGR